MFRCQYTIFRQFTVVLAEGMDCWMIKYDIVVCGYGKMLVNVAVCVIGG